MNDPSACSSSIAVVIPPKLVCTVDWKIDCSAHLLSLEQICAVLSAKLNWRRQQRIVYSDVI